MAELVVWILPRVELKMVRQRHVPTPQETGGAGARYEDHVGAYFLARLLIGGMSPIFTDSRVEEVRLQTRRLGWETDDLLVVCSTEHDEQHQIAIQSKRNFVLRASNRECCETIEAFWKDFRNSEIFDPENDALVLATQPSSEALRTGLIGLTDCARNSTDESDFAWRVSPGGIASEKVRDYHSRIKRIIEQVSPTGPSDDELWRFLKSVYLLNLDLTTGTSQGEASTKSMLALASGEPSNSDVVRGAWLALVDLAAESAAGGKDVRLFDLPRDLRRKFSAHGHQDENLEPISDLNLTYMSGNQNLDIDGTVVDRGEISDILSDFVDDQLGNTVLVSGRSGVGKTSVVSQFLSTIDAQGWPTLLLRVDHMPPAPSPIQLGQSLGLTKSPVAALADIAGERNCLLVIDQLDALSLASRRHPGFFECVVAILRQSRRCPNMKVLLACRQFDIEDNRRLGELVNGNLIVKRYSIEPFDEETVRTLVNSLGIDPDELNQSQIGLLSLPIHLKLLAYIVSEAGITALDFQTEKELYDRFWREKQESMRSRISNSQIQAAVDRVVMVMADREALFVPEQMLRLHEEAVTLLVSENILVKDGPRVSFFHDSFFDFMFAQWFISEDLDLSEYILKQDQSLFMRSQVTQVLMHQRDISSEYFIRDLQGILTNGDVRIHLKTAVISLLGSIDTPTREEWSVMEPLLGTELSGHVWTMLHRSEGWFDLLHSLDLLRSWMSGDNPLFRHNAVALLQSIQNQRPDEVAELMMPYIGVSDDWDVRLSNVIFISSLGATRKYFEFVCKAVRSGAFDRVLLPSHNSVDLWFRIEGLVEQEPERSCELIGCCFERLTEMAGQSEYSNSFVRTGYPIGRKTQVMADAARSAPEIFVESLMPHLLYMITPDETSPGNPSLKHMLWNYPTLRKRHQLDADLIAAMEVALCKLAEQEPDVFLLHAEKLHPSDFSIIQGILVRAYAENGERLADDAVSYLLEDTARLASGGNDEKYRLARNLIESVSPHCSVQNYTGLEATILDFCPDYELDPVMEEHKGYAQGILLEGLDSERISTQATQRLRALRERFGEELSREPREPVAAGFVGSPISEQDAREMSDDDWFREFAYYSSALPDDPENFLKGGAIQLSQLLETLVKEDPGRFAKLVHRIPDDANPAYFEAILRGVTGASIDMETVVATCIRCHDIPNRPLGRSITSPLAAITESPLPQEALELVSWYATKDPDPSAGAPSLKTYSQFGQEHTEYDPLYFGINSVRGWAALSMAKLIFRDEMHMEFFRPYLSNLVNDPSDAVRACVAEVLVGVLKYDRGLAVDLFLQLCNTDERLLATEHFERFLKYSSHSHFTRIEPVLSQMMASSDEKVAEAGALWMCYSSLAVEEARPLASQCAAASKALRLGAVEVYAENLRNRDFREVCEEMLRVFFDDPDIEVRQSAARCFYKFEGQELLEYQNFVRQFISSQAFETAYDLLFYVLEKTDADVDDIILTACERFLSIAGEDIADIRTAVARTSLSMSKLVRRVNARANDPTTKERCLDIIDKMSLAKAYGLEYITRGIDR